MNYKFRIATLNDCDHILEIYQYYVLNTAITFEYEVPSVQEMQTRMQNIQLKYPYLVALADDKIIGYAYASDFRYRMAYQWSPESTIYMHKEFKGKGIGKTLYQKLFELLKVQGFYNVFAGVGLPNDSSIALHQKCNFKEIGVYENIGYKFEKWHSTKWYQLKLKEYILNPPFPAKLNEVPIEELNYILK